MHELFEITDRANKTALLLVQERYDSRFASFVKSSKARLAYVERDLEELIHDASVEAGADQSYVKRRFDQYLADAVLEKDPATREDLSYKGEGGLPPEKYDPTDGSNGTVHKDDPLNLGETEGLGAEESRQPDATVDLGQYTHEGEGAGEVDKGPLSTSSCFRCGDKPVSAGFVVCPDCTTELHRQADYTPLKDSPFGVDHSQEPVNQEMHPTPEDLPYQCKICGYPGDGQGATKDEITAHVQDDHNDILQRAQQEQVQQPGFEQESLPMAASVKQADVPEATPEGTPKVDPLPTSSADRFDEMVQDLADRAAAEQLSTPTPEEVHAVSSQLGLPTEEVQQSLVATALVGKYMGMNGKLAESIDAPEGYQEVAVDQGGGRIEGREALVGSNAVINKVAEEMNSTPDLVYQEVKARYGGEDLPDKYHASISGERHFFLPSQLAGQGQQQQQVQDPNVGPAAAPAPEATPPAPQQQQTQQQY